MAIFPCDVGSHRYPGPQNTIYPAVVKGSEVFRRKLRLCSSHFIGFRDQLLAHCHSDQLDMDDQALLHCALCDQDVTDSAWQFFATVYAAGHEREDFWAPAHLECVTPLREDWLLMRYGS